MHAVEFTAELNGAATLVIPAEVAARLPRTGRARVIVLTEAGGDVEDLSAPAPVRQAISGDAEWRAASYEQFLADDSPEDAIYETLR